MDDRIDLAELLSRYADIADMKEFTHLPSRICTDPLTVDFEAVTGMPAVTASLRDCVELLRTTLAPFAATHHAITGHVVTIDGDSATIHAHVRAEHWLPVELVGDGPDRWLVVGFYDTEAVRTPKGWRISRFKLTVTHQENPQLASLAQAAEQARRPQA
ncbi:nuclear transport factor 2 family protein [Streptomyces xiangluensis]|nr:nuclear transport factor 2 family protein [Streptomyces yerevanensis]